MKNLKAKLRKNGGFTLIEMLIVVAIIAILIAISIPLVGQALEKSREATDAANERSFKAELILCYLSGNTDGSDTTTAANKFETNKVYFYDATNGKIETSKKGNPYGQGTADAGAHKTNGGHTNMYLWGYIDGNGNAKLGWAESASGTSDIKDVTLTGPILQGGTTTTTTGTDDGTTE